MTLEPTTRPDSAPLTSTSETLRLPGLLTAALASIGAGTIHGAVSGLHTEHRQLLGLFLAAAAVQIGIGVWTLLRPSRLAAAALVVVNLAAVGAWLVTRMTGVSWIDGLETREAPAFVDTASALLGTIAFGAALGALVVERAARRAPGRSQLALPALAVTALALPAMWIGLTSTHSHGGGEGHAHAPGTTLPRSAIPVMTWPPTDTVVDARPTTSAAAGPSTTLGAVTVTTTAAGPASSLAITVSTPPSTAVPSTVPATTAATTTTTIAGPTVEFVRSPKGDQQAWPRPWDPAQPFDISGVKGVSAEQEARAKQLIIDTMRELPHWASTETAKAEGYHSIGDAATGDEHYINTDLIEDDVMLDPKHPESLVYRVDGDKRILAGVMFIASARPTDDPTLTRWAGPLMTWHNHGNLCWAIIDNVPKVVGITDAKGKCRYGVNTGGENPMVHVWIVPHLCGPFAALEGVGAGQTAVSEDKRTDLCNAANHHG